jgi:L-fucose isomerase-like protein
MRRTQSSSCAVSRTVWTTGEQAKIERQGERKKMNKITLGMMVGTRDFFPAEPVLEARREVLALLEQLDVDAVILDEDATNMGAVETWEDSNTCATLFREKRDQIDGILVVLPVFGPEKGIADAIRLSELDVPILIQAYPDDPDELAVATRRDAFCGKISVCNNLYQYRIPFTVTQLHTVHPSADSFRADLEGFVGVCRVVGGLKGARLGAIGARPSIFNTVRYSEKLLEEAGISVLTVDLSEIFSSARRMTDQDPKVRDRVEGIRAYLDTSGVPSDALVRMAKLGVAIDDWAEENSIDAAAVQCWTSIQENYGVNACALMSMMSESMMPTACEVDIMGTLSMYALQLASGQPSALVDWNNNYADDPNKCILFHCGNWPMSFLCDAKMANAEILATVLGEESTYGTVAGRAKAGPLTFARVDTDDWHGKVRAYVGEGQITDDPLKTFGCRAVAEIPRLQALMQYVCKRGFAHHCAMNASHTAEVLVEAFETYLGWNVYHHG